MQATGLYSPSSVSKSIQSMRQEASCEETCCHVYKVYVPFWIVLVCCDEDVCEASTGETIVFL